MTISISPQAYNELLQQETVERSQHPDPDDALDAMYKHPQLLGAGYWRLIELRQGLMVTIGDFRLGDRLQLNLLTRLNDQLTKLKPNHIDFSSNDLISLLKGIAQEHLP